MNKPDCIFCKIINGDIPSKTIYEDDLFKVIMDIEPATKGHVLILPKNHYENLYSLGEEEAKALIPLAQKLANKIKTALNCDGMNMVQNNGAAANQTVMHFHLHLIPRYENDNNKERLSWNHEELSAEQLNEIYELLK